MPFYSHCSCSIERGILFLCVFLFGFASNSFAQNEPIVKTFDFTGNIQSWDIPFNVSFITISATGASGGDGHSDDNALVSGGFGASTVVTINVADIHALDIAVGGKGSTVSRSGVGAGGGHSAVRIKDDNSQSGLLVMVGGGAGSTGYLSGSGGDELTDLGAGGSAQAGGSDTGGGGGGFLEDGQNLRPGDISGGQKGFGGAGGSCSASGGFGGGGAACSGGTGGGGGAIGGNGGLDQNPRASGGSSYIADSPRIVEVISFMKGARGQFLPNAKVGENGKVTISYSFDEPPIPTIGQWGLIILFLVLASMALVLLTPGRTVITQ